MVLAAHHVFLNNIQRHMTHQRTYVQCAYCIVSKIKIKCSSLHGREYYAKKIYVLSILTDFNWPHFPSGSESGCRRNTLQTLVHPVV